VTSSGGLIVTVISGGGSTAVNLPTVTSAGFAPVTSSAGLLTNLSSGTVTLSSNPTVISASSGFVQVFVTGSSGAASPVTSSGGLGVTILGGAAAGSTAVNLTNFSGAGATVTSSIGLNVNITNPSGPVTSSYGVLVQISSGSAAISASLTSGTVTLSSAPTVVSASSGIIQIVPSSGTAYRAFNFNASSSGSIINVTTSAVILYGWNVGSQVSGVQVAVKLYNSTGPTVGSTTNLIITIPIPGSTAGAGNNFFFELGTTFNGGLSMLITDNFASTSTAFGHNAGDIVGQLYYL
jgi:hypothetical protein